MNARRCAPSCRPASIRSANIAVSPPLRRSRPNARFAYTLSSFNGARFSGGHRRGFPAHHCDVEVEVVAHHAVAGEALLCGRATVLGADLIDALDSVGHLLDAV